MHFGLNNVIIRTKSFQNKKIIAPSFFIRTHSNLFKMIFLHSCLRKKLENKKIVRPNNSGSRKWEPGSSFRPVLKLTKSFGLNPQCNVLRQACNVTHQAKFTKVMPFALMSLIQCKGNASGILSNIEDKGKVRMYNSVKL